MTLTRIDSLRLLRNNTSVQHFYHLQVIDIKGSGLWFIIVKVEEVETGVST